MMRIRLELERIASPAVQLEEPERNITLGNDQTFKDVLHTHEQNFSKTLFEQDLRVEERLSRVEALLKAQTTQMQVSQVSQMGSLYDVSPPAYRKRATLPMSPISEEHLRMRSEAVGVRLRQTQYSCRPKCPCACHTQQRSVSPSFMKQALGQLFVGYAGLPVLGNKCDALTCERSQIPSINVEYWFPLGFCWSQIIRLQFAYQTNIGPSFQISTLRRVPDSAQSVSFSLSGNIDGLKRLLSQGLASPRDVSSTRGYSLLRWALYGQQYEMCKFLMNAGSQVLTLLIAASDDCPSDKACDIILRGGLPREVVEILRIIAEGSDFMDDQNFTALHKIVLGLSYHSLEQEICKDPSNVDLRDSTGRTPLQWAAARGDKTAVVTLLSYGADPNNMDKKLNTPLTLAANQNHTICVRLLLEAGALPDLRLPDGVKFGTPLNCAARNATDPMLMKTLLDFNANIEASGVDGMTPLLHVARGSSATQAMLLLEYGANINATSKTEQTPLTAAIEHNNHGVLRLLLERWFEYNECPRLKGPNLLEVVAQYADAQTMQILAATEHLRARTDNTYIIEHCFQVLEARTDASEKLLGAFNDLISVLKSVDNSARGIDSKMEAGLIGHFEALEMSDQDSDSDLTFEDAKEHLQPLLEPTPSACPAFILQKRTTI
ncbi:hypothetical protein KVR01_010904 [Diaporthe batatas]|uniref:uncharacterized protein n=1 Tax=Diaporthe batatas TaxID=748121 RepID=UPI001D038259|nr:uncharacterized protein KVR01_010904 [Diaporthe batatas]KAG8159243.1 hypothetical protein KVR01_010904 [Diaporthe batatas]